MDLQYLTKHPSSRSSCPSSKRSKQTNQTTQAAPCSSREGTRTPHGPALMPVISGQGRSPSARPGGLPPPRRPITATPPLRPVLDSKAGTEAAYLRLQHGAVPPRPEPSAEAEHWSSPRAPKAQDNTPRQEGSKTASRAARSKIKQPSFSYKYDAHIYLDLVSSGVCSVQVRHLAVCMVIFVFFE